MFEGRLFFLRDFVYVTHLVERGITTWGIHVPELYEGRGGCYKIPGEVRSCAILILFESGLVHCGKRLYWFRRQMD